MSQTYGQTIKWSTVGAPQPCSAILESYNYRASDQQHLEDNASADLAAMVLHGQTGAINFGGTITNLTVDLPDLSTGAKITIEDAANIAAGTVLCSKLIEEWVIGQPKKFSGEATHYPHCVGGAGASAGALNGFTPNQVAPVIRPAASLIWGTSGLTHAGGTVQRLRIEQTLTLTAEPDAVGNFVTVTAHRYFRKIMLEILATSAASRPANQSTLAVVGAPAHASNAVVTDSEIKWTRGRSAMFAVEAMWFPGMIPPP